MNVEELLERMKGMSFSESEIIKILIFLFNRSKR